MFRHLWAVLSLLFSLTKLVIEYSVARCGCRPQRPHTTPQVRPSPNSRPNSRGSPQLYTPATQIGDTLPHPLAVLCVVCLNCLL